jgi:transposase
MKKQTKTKVSLKGKTKKKLQKIFNSSNSSPQFRTRIQMVLLRDKGKTLDEIATVVFKSRRTVITWLKTYKEKRIKGLKSNYQANNNKLTKEQKKEIKNFLESKMKSKKEIKGFTSQELRLYIKKKYKVEYRSNTSINNIFYRCQFSFRKPEKYYSKSDPKETQQWKREVKKN